MGLSSSFRLYTIPMTKSSRKSSGLPRAGKGPARQLFSGRAFGRLRAFFRRRLVACRLRRRPGFRLLAARLRLGFRLVARRRLLPVSEDLGDADQREFLAVAALAPRVLAPALLERDDLVAALVPDHLAGHAGAAHGGAAHLNAVAAEQEHFELDDIAWLALELVDLDHVVGGDAVLLPAGLDDCEHLSVLVFGSGLGLSVRTGFFQSVAVDAAAFALAATGRLRPKLPAAPMNNADHKAREMPALW